MLRQAQPNQLDVYDVKDYSSRGNITIPLNYGDFCFSDMAACCFHRCLYIVDWKNKRIVKLQMPSKLSTWKLSTWAVDDISCKLISVTSEHYVLVVCGLMLKLFSTDGVLQVTVNLQPDIVNVTSAVELTPGQYLVSQRPNTSSVELTPGQYLVSQRPNPFDSNSINQLHRVCVVNSEGEVLHTHGGFQGSHHTLLNSPRDVAIDKDGFVYVVEENISRLIVLTPKLGYIHCINNVASLISRSSLSAPRLKIDKQLMRIYVRHVGPNGYSSFCEVFQLC